MRAAPKCTTERRYTASQWLAEVGRHSTLAFAPTASVSHNIRIATIDGEPWFVAIDVARALGLEIKHSGVWMHTRKLDATEKRTAVKTPNAIGGVPAELFEGNTVHLTLISESGLYKLIMRSDKPEAKVFQDWVTKEVLPSIRKTAGRFTQP